LLYAARVNLELVARCGVESGVEDTSLVYVPNPDPAMQAAMQRVAGDPSGGWRVALAPAGTWSAKTADPGVFATLARHLTDAGCQVLLLWGPGEEKVCRQVASSCGTRVTLAPPTTLDELAWVLKHSDLLISHDSGIKHLAVAVGTSTLTLFGPTEPRAWMPPEGPHDFVRADLPCLACNFTRCLHRSCMRQLTGEDIAQRAVSLLQRVATRRSA